MKVSRQKSFAVFALFCMSAKFFICKFKMTLFIYGFKRGSAKAFHEGLRVQLAAKLFCLETFMAYGMRLLYCVFDALVIHALTF